MNVSIGNNVSLDTLEGWDDLRFPANTINPAGSTQPPTVDTTETGFLGTLLFSGSTTEMIPIIAQMPHSWDKETSIYPHIHWHNVTGNSNTTRWDLYYRLLGTPGSAPQDWVGPITSSTTIGDPTVTAQHLISSFGAIDLGDTKESCIVLFRLYRMGALDTSTTQARLLEFDIHYQKNKNGTSTMIPT